MRNIGIDVKYPEKTCNDEKCPFHGKLSIRGMIMKGTVVSAKMQNTAIIERKIYHYLPKYERYYIRIKRYSVHNPPCINAQQGDLVKVGECRKLSKTVSFTIIEKLK